jgi:hypothetical protein
MRSVVWKGVSHSITQGSHITLWCCVTGICVVVSVTGHIQYTGNNKGTEKGMLHAAKIELTAKVFVKQNFLVCFLLVKNKMYI